MQRSLWRFTSLQIMHRIVTASTCATARGHFARAIREKSKRKIS
jgi:hypothetical protein